jgi:lysophospholipid acyltransferase (LPLAT)-like uncharacterized protein
MTSAGGSRLAREEVQFRAAAVVGGALFSALFATCRFEVSGEENYLRLWDAGQPVVFVLWHGRLLAGTYRQRGNGLVALISQHRDGEYIARVVQRWGYGTVRGSSTRGGSGAMRGLLRQVRDGRSVVLTPDGPQGPREQMKAGALAVAQLTGAPVIPVATGAERAWTIRSGWDRFQIPKPFSRIRLIYGEPVPIPRNATEAEIAAYSELIQQRLNTLMRAVDGER